MQDAENAVFLKCAWRLIPFMGLLYVVNFLDRVNVGFAALAMNRDIGLSAHAYGVGAGMFFVGYFFFEVPSNVIMEKVGARLWMFRIMLSWGLISMLTAFARGPYSFAALRFSLGVCEAGFFPGMILYLTYWFPASTRGQFNAMFLAAIVIANVIGGPISGTILHAAGGVAGLYGWQWLFVLEGLPSCILAFVALVYLTDTPAHAIWLDLREKRIIHDALARDAIPSRTLRDGLADYRVWILAIGDLGIITSLYGIGLWLPQIVRGLGFSDVQTGFVVSIPYLATLLAMVAWARDSDRRAERVRHVVWPALLAATAFLVTARLGTSLWSVVALSIASVGIYSALVVFWTLPQSFLGGTAAAGAIALVNSIANLGGFFGPTVVGYLKDATGTYAAAMVFFAFCLVASSAIVWRISKSLPATGVTGNNIGS